MTGQKHKNLVGASLDPKKYIFARFQKFRTYEIISCMKCIIIFEVLLHTIAVSYTCSVLPN